MRKVLLMTAIMIQSALAVDIRIGSGSYDAEMSIKGFMNHDTTHDITVFSLSQAHKNINKTPLFYYYDAEFHTSDTKRQETQFANYAANYSFPLVGSINDMTNALIDMVPVDADYQTVGFDMNFGLGYDVLRKKESYLGLALNIGATLPNIDADNLTSNASLAYDLIDDWELDVSTYKIGPAVKGSVELYPAFSLYGSYSLGYQTASVESGLFKSSVDVDGDYSALDIGLRYQKEKFYIRLGHMNKKWGVDSVNVNLYNFFEADIFSPFTLDLKSNYTYIGVGYSF